MDLPAGWTTGTTTVDGIGLQYYRTGDGPPIVAAHGLFDDGRRWVPLASALADEFEVIAYDARGHGRSDAPESGYDIDTRVADLVGLVDGLDLEDPSRFRTSPTTSTTPNRPGGSPGPSTSAVRTSR